MVDAYTAIITSVLSSVTVLASIWYKDYYIARKLKAKSNAISMQDKSMFYLEMDKTCGVIREALYADGTYLAYFHNGGVFANGIAMDKFTVVGEDYNEKIHCSNYKKTYYATMINYMSYAYHRLLTNNRYYVPIVADVSDLSFKDDLSRRKVSSMYMFLIKDPITDKPIGFFAVEYVKPYTFDKINESEIWKHQNKLSRLLNMTVLNENV